MPDLFNSNLVMLTRIAVTLPFARDAGCDVHRYVPLTCAPACPRTQLVQRRVLPAGLLRQQVARSVAVMAMAPLLSEGVPEHQAEGEPAGEYAKLKVRKWLVAVLRCQLTLHQD